MSSFHIVILGTKGEALYILIIVYHLGIIKNMNKYIHAAATWD
jgi:hypothetical protein